MERTGRGGRGGKGRDRPRSAPPPGLRRKAVSCRLNQRNKNQTLRTISVFNLIDIYLMILKKLTKNISEFYLKILENFDQNIFPKCIWRFWKKLAKNISEMYLKILKKCDQYSLRGPPSLGGVGGRSQTCHLSKCFNFFLSLKPYVLVKIPPSLYSYSDHWLKGRNT